MVILNTRLRALFVSAISAAALAGPATSFGAGYFADSTKINVLRQYNDAGVQLVTTSQTPMNNGSASGSSLASGVGYEFVLPVTRTVNSYSVQFGGYGFYYPNSFLLEGWTGASYVPLINVVAPGGVSSGTFTSGPTAVSKIRFTPTGAPNTYIIPDELQIFASAGQSIDTRYGYNFLRDATVTSQSSPNITNVWKDLAGGSPIANLIDGDYGDAPHIKALDNANGTSEREYLAFKLAAPRKMDFANMGFYPGQGWETFEIYTANTDLIASLNTIGTYPNKAAMLAAGWTLQYEHTGATITEPIQANFLAKGEYQYMVWVANEGQSGATNEFEVFGVPEPTSAGVLLAGLGLLSIRRKRRA